MFVSDKDLKKVPNNKRPATTASSAVINSKHNVPVKQQPNTIISSNSVSATSNTIDVVERTRIEREQRQLLRDQLVYVVKIQAYCRGHKVRSNLLKNLRLELDKKLQDIEKVAVAVKAQADIEFSPPSNITMGLLPQLLFLKHRSSDDVTRFLRFLKLMINPSLSQADPTKNLICELTFPSNMQVMNQLNDLSLGSLLIATTSKRDASFSEPALIFLGLLCGLNTNKLNNALDGHFQVARSHVLINGFLTKIRNLLTCSGESLMKVTVNEDILSKSPDFNRIQLTHCSHIVSRCVRICMKLTESCSNNELNGRLADFTREILCVPHLTCLITPATTTKLASWPLLGSLLLQLKDKINSNTLALPPLKHDVIQSGQVLFGNIASLAPKLPILPTRASIHPERSASGSTTGNVFDSMNGQDGEYIHYNDTVVQAYISTTTALIVRYPVAGVFEGKSGVMWVKNETSMIASAIPVSLHAQVLCLLHPEYLRALYSRILLPIRTDLNTYALEADIADIHLAKTKTGLQLAQDIIKHEQEASVWFTSKWASKLVSNVTKTIGLKSSGIIDSKGSISASASIGKNNEEDSGYSAVKGEAEDSTIVLTDSEFTLNPALVACLVSQWALLLSQSVGAPIHSAPFRALSTLAYATNSLDRLWAALITLPISQISATVKDSLFSQVSSSRNFAQPLSGKHVSSVEKSTTSSSSSSSSFLSIFTSPWTNKPSSSSSSTSAMPVSISNTNTASSGNKKVSAVLFDNQNKSSIDVDNQRTLESLVSNMDFYVQFIPEGPLAFIVVISCLMRTHLIALDDSEFYTQEVISNLMSFNYIIFIQS